MPTTAQDKRESFPVVNTPEDVHSREKPSWLAIGEEPQPYACWWQHLVPEGDGAVPPRCRGEMILNLIFCIQPNLSVRANKKALVSTQEFSKFSKHTLGKKLF